MAIAFTCPHCGKRFKASDTMAGKKGRCSGCRNVVVIPDPGFEILDDPQDSEGNDGAPSAETGRPPVEVAEDGSRIESLTVEESSTSRLVLGCAAGRHLLFVLSGAAALLLGLVGIAGMDSAIPAARAQGKPLRVPVWAVMIPIGLLGYGGFTLCLIGRLGYRLTFDRDTESLDVRRLYVWEQTWPAVELGGVIFLVEKPNKHDEGDPECAQICEAYVIDRDGKPVALIERVEIKDARYLVPLADICLQAGRLLNLPVAMELRGKPSHAELRRALERIRKSNAGRGSRPAPAFRKPLVTTYKVAGVVGGLLIVIGVGRFFVKHTWFGGVLPQAAAMPAPAPVPVQGPVGVDPQLGRLIGELQSPEKQTRLLAALQLAHLQPVAAQRETVRQALRAVASEEDGMARAEALKALGRWGTDADVPLLIEALSSPNIPVRDAAAEALSQCKDIRGAEAMARLLHDPDRRFSMAIRLRSIGPPASPCVLLLLDDPDDAVKLEAAKIMESVGTPDDLPALRSALEHYQGLASQVPRGGLPGPLDPEAMSQARFAGEILGPLRDAIRIAATR